MKLNSFTLPSLALLGAGVLFTTGPQASALTFSIDEFTGGDSTVKISITQGDSNSVNFLLEIIKPPGPSNSDLSGFWGHIADESLVTGLSVTDVKFGYQATPPAYTYATAPAADYVFAHVEDGIGVVGHNNNNLNGSGQVFSGFDFGFYFAHSNGLDTPPINAVKFTLTNASGLSESDFVGQLFGARLQPLDANPSSSKLAGTSAVPDGGTTLVLLGASMSAIGLIRRKLN